MQLQYVCKVQMMGLNKRVLYYIVLILISQERGRKNTDLFLVVATKDQDAVVATAYSAISEVQT